MAKIYKEEYEHLAYDIVFLAFNDYIKEGIKKDKAVKRLNDADLTQSERQKIEMVIIQCDREIWSVECFIRDTPWLDHVWTVPYKDTIELLKKKIDTMSYKQKRRRT